MEMKIFINDWLYHQTPVFRNNDREFLQKLDEYKEDLFKTIVKNARKGMPESENLANTQEKINANHKKGSDIVLMRTYETLRSNQGVRKEGKRFPVVVTELINSQRKRVSFPNEKIECAIYVDKQHQTAGIEVIPESYKAEDFETEVIDNTEEVNFIFPIVHKPKRETYIWQHHIRKLRGILKILEIHKNDGLSEFIKFLKRHHITNNYSIRKVQPDDKTAEKFIVEHILSLLKDLQHLRQSSRNLMYSKNTKRQKVRHRIVTISDDIITGLEACLHKTGSGAWLDPKNLYYRLYRVERMYTNLYNDDIVSFLSISTFGNERRKKVMIKKHKTVQKQENHLMTATVHTPIVLRECKSDLISILKPPTPVSLKPPTPVSLKTVSMSALKTHSYPSLLSIPSLMDTGVNEDSVDDFMLEIKALLMNKLNVLLEMDNMLEKKHTSKKAKRIGELNKALCIQETSSVKDNNEVESLVETWDSLELVKEKLHNYDVIDSIKPDFNERLAKVEDSLILISKQLKKPLNLKPRIKTPYNSETDLTCQISRSSACLDLLEDTDTKPVLQVEKQVTREKVPIEPIFSEKIVVKQKKNTKIQIPKMRWVP